MAAQRFCTKAKPFKSLQELGDWWEKEQRREVMPEMELRRCKVKLASRAPVSDASEPRILACHDMAGYGEVEDADCQGNDTSKLIYTVQHWNLMDIFVYFSHHRVTIPPPVWTTAAHRQGVKVLGTFITEQWIPKPPQNGCPCEKPPPPPPTLLDNLLLIYGPNFQRKTHSSHLRYPFDPYYANALVDAAVYFGFDGWLINIEARYGNTNDTEALIDFMVYFTAKMHQAIPGSLVIWYDSLSVAGEIAWQDKLNFMNKPFFDACDGMFTNYTWKQDYPRQSRIFAEKHPHSQHRAFDIFTGIDIFGRNTYGGGGMHTPEALDVIYKAPTSVALFAIAWTYETSKAPLEYQARDAEFWVGLPDANGSQSRSCATYITRRPSGGTKFFITNFCTGLGHRLFLDGKCVSTQPWSHIGRQSLQPLSTSNHPRLIEPPLDNVNEGTTPRLSSLFTCSVETGTHDAFNSDSVLVLAFDPVDTLVFDTLDQAESTFELFELNLSMEKSAQVSVVFQLPCTGLKAKLQVRTRSRTYSQCLDFDTAKLKLGGSAGWTNLTFDIVGSEAVCGIALRLCAQRSTVPSSRLVIGQISIVADPMPLQMASKAKLAIALTPYDNGVLIHWDEPEEEYQAISAPYAIERYEVFVSNVWIGTAFTNTFFWNSPATCAQLEVVDVRPYNYLGQLIKVTA